MAKKLTIDIESDGQFDLIQAAADARNTTPSKMLAAGENLVGIANDQAWQALNRLTSRGVYPAEIVAEAQAEAVRQVNAGRRANLRPLLNNDLLHGGEAVGNGGPGYRVGAHYRHPNPPNRMYFPTRRTAMKRITIATLFLTSLVCASSDSLALARFRQDSTIAVGLLKQAASADSTAFRLRIQAQTVYDLAARNLQRDTAKVAK